MCRLKLYEGKLAPPFAGALKAMIASTVKILEGPGFILNCKKRRFVSKSSELNKRKIKRVFVAGLATDYCMKPTALDAMKNGFEIVVLTNLVRADN